MSALPEQMITSAVITMLATAVNRPVGDHGTKDVAGTPIDTSGQYLIVHRIEGGAIRGSLGDPQEDVTLVYQVDSHAPTRLTCEGLARLANAAMTDIAAAGGHVHVLAGNGWKGGLRERQVTGRPEPHGTGDTGTETWTQRERFEVEVHWAPGGVASVTTLDGGTF